MTLRIEHRPTIGTPLIRPGTAPAEPVDDRERGLGALFTERGNLPLDQVDVLATITGLSAKVDVAQHFRNSFEVPLEATYIFPLPDRAAVVAMRMETADGTVVARLQERAAARQAYDRAIEEGKRASIAEEERPGVFTLRVGNIPPGERVIVRLTLVQPLPYADGEAEFRFPLVVAPRYVPGTPLDGTPTGAGTSPDTDAVPDASRISPPVLLPGSPDPVRLNFEVDLDPAGLPLALVRSSLHALPLGDSAAQGAPARLRLQPGERLDRDVVLRFPYGSNDSGSPVGEPGHVGPITGLDVGTDGSADGDDTGSGAGAASTFRLTLLPPHATATTRPRELVLLIDRSGSMGGWKMVAARRAAARMIDTLTDTDTFAVRGFDSVVESPPGLSPGLVPATDRNRFRAVEYLAGLSARGGTVLLDPMRQAVDLLTGETATPPTDLTGEPDGERDRVIVLITDGQVGNEDQIVAELAGRLTGLRVHTVGIDQAVNAGFLGRLAVLGGGRCELVESEDRLDEAAEHIHQRIGTPVLSAISLSGNGIELDQIAPARLPALFDGVPLVITGRVRAGAGLGAITVTGRTADGEPWTTTVTATEVADATALRATWARARLRDLEDAYAATRTGHSELEQQIVATSLEFGVLCRFTAYVAIDERVVVEAGQRRTVVQPVEPPAGWEMPAGPQAMMLSALAPGAIGSGAARYAAGPPDMLMRSAPAAAPAPPGGSTRARLGRGRQKAVGHRPAAPEREVAIMLPAPPELAGVELARLRAAAGSPLVQRRRLLGDLATRLTTLLGPDGAPVPELGRLAAELAVCDGDDAPSGEAFEQLWRHCLEVLERFSSATSAGPASTPASAPAPAAGFWKRG